MIYKFKYIFLKEYSMTFKLSIKKDVFFTKKTIDNYYNIMDCDGVPFDKVEVYYLKIPKKYDLSFIRLKYDDKLITGFKLDDKKDYYEVVFYDIYISYFEILPLLEKAKLLKIKYVWFEHYKPFDTYFDKYSMGEFIPFYYNQSTFFQTIYNISTKIIELVLFLFASIVRNIYIKYIKKEKN